ncbi:uncharacterized protein LOC114531876 [Dendronephthya gigantea]|uniref:uncharacterized protein LOC114531876 n=1 Tax=Dendronephthya gigantea TaxID=151771 RepID=UPI00106A05D9|nr:uncharacterized protein LOC114531876 [Dendronephthya gigantea]
MNSEDIGSDDHHQYDRDQNVRKKEQKENDTAGYIGPQNSDDGKCPIEIDSDSERQLDRINSSNSVPPSYGATQQHDKSSSSNNNIVQSNEIDASSSDTMMLLTANDDLLYASLLFDENMPWSDSESEY